MHELNETRVQCPYCNEPLNILIDPTEAGQEYIEDCQVCCRPIVMFVQAEGMGVIVRAEDEI